MKNTDRKTGWITSAWVENKANTMYAFYNEFKDESTDTKLLLSPFTNTNHPQKPQNKPLSLQYIPIIIVGFQNLISINPIT